MSYAVLGPPYGRQDVGLGTASPEASGITKDDEACTEKYMLLRDS